MKKFCFVFCAALLISPWMLGETDQTESKAQGAPGTYQSATLLKLVATMRTVPRDVSHTTWTNAVIVSEKIVTYDFTVQSGPTRYTSRYTPEKQPGDLPHAWWQGNAPVQIRVKKRTLFIKLPDGTEVLSRIVNQTTISK